MTTTSDRSSVTGARLHPLDVRARLLDALRRPDDDETGAAPGIGTEHVLLADAVGRTSAGTVRSADPVPGFRTSAMDGFALRHADGTGPLPIDGVVLAGGVHPRPLPPGAAVRIMTGAAVPDGADTVVPLERTDAPGRHRAGHAMEPTIGIVDGSTVTVVDAMPERGRHIRPAGDDLAAGQVILRPGRRIGVGAVGALAAAGIQRVQVVRRPTIAIVATGDELARGGERLAPGTIRNSNGPMLTAILGASGCEVIEVAGGADDLDALTEVVADACDRADVVVTTGGVSVGDADLVPAAFDRVSGGRAHHVRMHLRPGKPLAWADGTLPGRARIAIGLPGNPVAAALGATLFVGGVVGALLRSSDASLVPVVVAATDDTTWDGVRAVPARLRASADGTWTAAPIEGASSHRTSSLVDADGFLLRGDLRDLAPGGAAFLPWPGTGLPVQPPM